MTALVAAVRHNDLVVVQRLVTDPATDVNECCDVEPIVQRRHESPLYRTTPLFEAVRQRNKDVVAALLSRADIGVNQTAVRAACARGKLRRSATHLSSPPFARRPSSSSRRSAMPCRAETSTCAASCCATSAWSPSAAR